MALGFEIFSLCDSALDQTPYNKIDDVFDFWDLLFQPSKPLQKPQCKQVTNQT